MGIAADLSLIIVFGLLLGAIAYRLGQPVLLGYIATGILLGPHTGFVSISDPHEIELLAEIGVALLLFAIGIEFSLKELRAVRRVAIFGTALQMSLTIVFGTVLGLLLGFDLSESVWIGALLSVSSTMVVLKVLGAGGLMGTLSGRVMLGMLIIQDLAVIPLMIVLPQIGGGGGAGEGGAFDIVPVLLAIGRSALFLVILVVVAIRIVPRLMHLVASWNSRELFLLTVVALGLGVGYLGNLFGVSFALGAFVAGLVLSESEYGHQALSDVIPLRDVFGLVFFASVGILFDPQYFVDNLARVGSLVVMVLQALVCAGGARLFGYRNIVPIAAGLGLSQIGEFSFLLANLGRSTESIGNDLHSLIIATTLVTLVGTPYLARLAGPLYRWIRSRRPAPPLPETPPGLEATDRPIVIAGAGRVGTVVASILAEEGLPFCVVDLDVARVGEARRRGWPVLYGDAGQESILRAAGIERARLAIVTPPSAVATHAIVARIRQIAPGVPVIVRTEVTEEIVDLAALGMVQTVQPEFEAALELARRSLVTLDVEPARIQRFLDASRREQAGATPMVDEDYATLVGMEHATKLLDLQWVEVRPGSRFDGARIGDLGVRKKTGVSIVAVVRGREIEYNPGPDTTLGTGDWLGVIGRPSQVEAILHFADGTHREADTATEEAPAENRGTLGIRGTRESDDSGAEDRPGT